MSAGTIYDYSLAGLDAWRSSPVSIPSGSGSVYFRCVPACRVCPSLLPRRPSRSRTSTRSFTDQRLPPSGTWHLATSNWDPCNNCTCARTCDPHPPSVCWLDSTRTRIGSTRLDSTRLALPRHASPQLDTTTSFSVVVILVFVFVFPLLFPPPNRAPGRPNKNSPKNKPHLTLLSRAQRGLSSLDHRVEAA